MAQQPVPGERFQYRLWHLLLVVTVVAVLLAAIVPLIRAAREAGSRMQCSNRLKQIGIALHNYHDAFQSFPAAYQVDGRGRIAHSWRVALWPFLMSDHRADFYDYNEPWNGPTNSKLQDALPSFVYRSPGDPNGRPGMTSFVAIVGPGTGWPGTSYLGMADLVDGTANTIMVVEIRNSNIHWMEPRDLPIAELEQRLDPKHEPTLLAARDYGQITGGIVLFADGQTEFLPHDTTMKRLRALLTPAGDDYPDAKGRSD